MANTISAAAPQAALSPVTVLLAVPLKLTMGLDWLVSLAVLPESLPDADPDSVPLLLLLPGPEPVPEPVPLPKKPELLPETVPDEYGTLLEPVEEAAEFRPVVDVELR